MNLIKTSLLSGISVAIKMFTMLGLNKFLSIYVGPAGFAVLGQFQNFIQIVTTLATGGIQTGVTKYTAEYHEDIAKQHAVWRSATKISACCSLVISLFVIAFNAQLANLFLKDDALGSVFIWLGSTLVLFSFNTLFLAIINGKKEINLYFIVNVVSSLFALVITVLMSMFFGLYGALISLATYQSLTFLVTSLMVFKLNWFKLKYLLGKVDVVTAKKLGKFTIMTLASAILLPASYILVRNNLIENLSLESAGYWEAMTRVSAAYLMLVTATLKVYFLPRLSELKSSFDTRNEIFQGYKFILPIVIIGGLIIYLMRETIISILFTSDFLEMQSLFLWQVIGDCLKIASWLLGYVLAARALTFWYVTSEILFFLIFVTLASLMTEIIGIEGPCIAHAINYALHFVFMVTLLKFKKLI